MLNSLSFCGLSNHKIFLKFDSNINMVVFCIFLKCLCFKLMDGKFNIYILHNSSFIPGHCRSPCEVSNLFCILYLLICVVSEWSQFLLLSYKPFENRGL